MLDMGCTDFRILAREVSTLPDCLNPTVSEPQIPRVIAAVMIHGEIIADGHASSARYAKVKASEAALNVLKGLSPKEFRDLCGCDCRLENESEDRSRAEGQTRGGGEEEGK